MIEQTQANRDFRPDYAALELNHNDDWGTVRENYRRLVHRWHPDRYAQKPRERAHAQQQFINLTIAYTQLRNFHRDHGHLPFQPAPTQSRRNDEQSASDRQHAGDRRSKSRQRRPGHIADDSDLLARKPANRDRDSSDSSARSRDRGRLAWMMAGGAVIVMTIATFVILDRQASLAVLERGREAVRQAPESDFMPTPGEIRRNEAKGAFIQPTQ